MAVVYFPAGGSADIAFAASEARWFDPRTAAWAPAEGQGGAFAAPPGADKAGHPLDMVLVLRR